MRQQTHTFSPPYAHINSFDINEDNMHVVRSEQGSIIKAKQCEALKMLYQTLFKTIFLSLLLCLTYTKVFIPYKLGLC